MLFAKIILAEQKDDPLNMASKHLLSFMYLYFQHPVEQRSLLFTYLLVKTETRKAVVRIQEKRQVFGHCITPNRHIQTIRQVNWAHLCLHLCRILTAA